MWGERYEDDDDDWILFDGAFTRHASWSTTALQYLSQPCANSHGIFIYSFNCVFTVVNTFTHLF